LKARAPKKLSEALVYALEEETEDNLAKETRKLFSHIKTSKVQQPQSSRFNSGAAKQGNDAGHNSKKGNSGQGCFKCGRTNHFARVGRASMWDREKFKAGQQGSQQLMKQPSISVLTCRYCQKEGHELVVCRKRQWVNSKK